MKKIFTILALALAILIPAQAQLSPVAQSINTGSERKMVRRTQTNADITLNDLVGTYEVAAESAFQGYPDEQWQLKLILDTGTENKVWLQPFMQIPGVEHASIQKIYAIFNPDEATLTIPLGQTLYGGEGMTHHIVLATVDDNDEKATPILTGDLVVDVTGTPDDILIEFNMLIGCGNIIANEWWYQAYTYTSFNKATPDPLVYIVRKDDKVTAIRAEQLFFVPIGDEYYVANTPDLVSDPVAGTYTARATSAFEGQAGEEWTVQMFYDENDKTKVWIQPILMFANLSAAEINPVYGTYDANAGTIVVPLGQTLYGGEGYDYHFVLGSIDNNYNPVIDSNLILNVDITNEGTTIEIPYVIGVGNLDEGEQGWWYQALGYTQFFKNTGALCALSDVDIITREMPTPEFNGFFRAGNMNWKFKISDDGKEYLDCTSATNFAYQGDIDLGSIYQGATGVIAHQWNVEGFMNDLGFFGETGASAPFPAYSYTFEVEGQGECEFLDIINPETGLASIGTLTLQGADGQPFETEVYWGEYDGQNLYTNLQFIATDGNYAEYNGVTPILWFLLDEQSYMLADFKDLIIVGQGMTTAPAYTKVNIYDKPVPVKMAGIKMYNK